MSNTNTNLPYFPESDGVLGMGIFQQPLPKRSLTFRFMRNFGPQWLTALFIIVFPILMYVYASGRGLWLAGICCLAALFVPGPLRKGYMENHQSDD